MEQSKPEDLDFMLLKLNRPVTENDQIWPLSLESNPVQLDDFVNIIQHPKPKQMTRALMAIVHRDAAPEEAAAILQQE